MLPANIYSVLNLVNNLIAFNAENYYSTSSLQHALLFILFECFLFLKIKKFPCEGTTLRICFLMKLFEIKIQIFGHKSTNTTSIRYKTCTIPELKLQKTYSGFRL